MAAGGATFLVTTAGALPLLDYVPSNGRWTFHPVAGVIAMDWYARAGASWIAFALAFAIARGLALRFAWAATPSVGRFALGLGFALTFWAASYSAMAVLGR